MDSKKEDSFIIQNHPLIVHLDDVFSLDSALMQRLMIEVNAVVQRHDTLPTAELKLNTEGSLIWQVHEGYQDSLISVLFEKLAYVLHCYLYKGALRLSALSLDMDDTTDDLLNIDLFCSEPRYVLWSEMLKALTHLPTFQLHLNVHFNPKRVTSFTDAFVVEPDFSLSFEFTYSEPLAPDEHGHEVYIQRYTETMTEHLRVLACPLLQTLQWVFAAECYVKHQNAMQHSIYLDNDQLLMHPIKQAMLIKNTVDTDDISEIHLSIKEVLDSLKKIDYLTFSTVFQGTLEYPESYHKSVRTAILRLLTNKIEKGFTFEVSHSAYHEATRRLQERMQDVGSFCRETLNAFVGEINPFKLDSPIVLMSIKRNDRQLFQQQINDIRHAISTLEAPEEWTKRLSDLLTQFDEKEQSVRESDDVLMSTSVKAPKIECVETTIRLMMNYPGVIVKQEHCNVIIPKEHGKIFRCDGQIYLSCHYAVQRPAPVTSILSNKPTPTVVRDRTPIPKLRLFESHSPSVISEPARTQKSDLDLQYDYLSAVRK